MGRGREEDEREEMRDVRERERKEKCGISVSGLELEPSKVDS